MCVCGRRQRGPLMNSGISDNRMKIMKQITPLVVLGVRRWRDRILGEGFVQLQSNISLFIRMDVLVFCNNYNWTLIMFRIL